MSTVVTTTSPKAWGPDVQALAPEGVIPESVLIAATSRVATVEGDAPSVRIPAINLEPDTGFVAEGANINEADPDLSEMVLNTGKVACLVKLSREQISQPNASATVTQEINRAMVSRVNFALLQQAAPVAPAAWPPAGLLVHATGGGVVTDNLDAIIDAVAAIEEIGGSATHILAAPSAWAALNKLKMFDAGEDAGSQSNASLLGSGTVAAQRTLLNVPVMSTVGMPTKSLLVLDKRMTLSAYGSLNVAISNDFYFGSDNVAVRATIRFGAGFSKAGAGVKLTVA